jgi:hypothetical protein
MDAEPPQSGSSLSPLKAAAILIVFVVATIVLVAYGTRAVTAPTGTPSSAATTSTTTVPGATTTTAPGQTTTSTTAHDGHHPTTTTTTVAHSSVTVVVANATNVSGLAAHYSTVIGAGGWNMQAPNDASTSETTSAVYYAPGQQQAAAAIATTIGVKPTQVLPISSSTPFSSTSGVDVVVIIGQDLATTPGA